MDLSKLKDEQVVDVYPRVLKELKTRGIIKTNNLVGDLGEYLAIKTYSETPRLPKLQDAPAGTKNIDAISTKGERYAIKSSSGTGTGVFASLPTGNDNKIYFEYKTTLKLIFSFSGLFLLLWRILRFRYEWSYAADVVWPAG